jgi:hypothetical protein
MLLMPYLIGFPTASEVFFPLAVRAKSGSTIPIHKALGSQRVDFQWKICTKTSILDTELVSAWPPGCGSLRRDESQDGRAGAGRDLSAWLGNPMQSNAIYELYRLEKQIKQTADEEIISDWRRLQASDHFYTMCTKFLSDPDVPKSFNPYDSPYDSYINFMNVLGHLHDRCSKRTQTGQFVTRPSCVVREA